MNLDLVKELFEKGGPAMWPLLALSVLSVATIVERLWFWLTIALKERAIVNRVLEAARYDWGVANEIARQANRQPIGRFLYAPLRLQNPDPELFRLALEAAADDEIAHMRRGDKVLEAVIALAPLLGLLGTVLGLINSLRSIRLGDLGTSSAAGVTLGIGEALISTATGLVVAITSLAFYRIFQAFIFQQVKIFRKAGSELELLYRQFWPHTNKFQRESAPLERPRPQRNPFEEPEMPVRRVASKVEEYPNLESPDTDSPMEEPPVAPRRRFDKNRDESPATIEPPTVETHPIITEPTVGENLESATTLQPAPNFEVESPDKDAPDAAQEVTSVPQPKAKSFTAKVVSKLRNFPRFADPNPETPKTTENLPGMEELPSPSSSSEIKETNLQPTSIKNENQVLIDADIPDKPPVTPAPTESITTESVTVDISEPAPRKKQPNENEDGNG